MILVYRQYLTNTGEVQGNETLTAIERRDLSFLDLAAAGNDRGNSLRPPNASSFPQVPSLCDIHGCSTISPILQIPFRPSVSVPQLKLPAKEQLTLSHCPKSLSAIGAGNRRLELSAFLVRQRGFH